MADPEVKPAEGEEEVEDVEEEDIEGDEAAAGDLARGLKNPEILAAMQEKMGSLVGGSSGYIQSLPKVVKRRIKALKKLQFEVLKIESEFYKEVHDLECKYATKYASLFEKRKEVATGAVEPNDEECEWPSDEEEEDKDLAEELKDKAKVTEEKEEKQEEAGCRPVGSDGDKCCSGCTDPLPLALFDEDAKGIPYFWSTVFKNVDMLSEMIQEHDEPILKHLQDVKVKFLDGDQAGFILEFYFEPNEYFTDRVLTKTYSMRFEPDSTDPFSFEGPEIIKCKGCPINWNKGKNVTVKVIKKKQKHKGRGTTRTVTKTVQNDSFFNFFSPPSVPEGEEAEMDEDLEALLAADFEIGHFIRERIVPRAVLYFTGEAIDNDEYDDEENEEEQDEEGEYDEENDPDFNPQTQGKPAECKQQ